MFSHDLRCAFRILTRSPGVTLGALLTFTLAIGANTAIFSVVYSVLLRPLSFREPARLVSVWPDTFLSVADLVFLRQHTRSFESIAAVSPGWRTPVTDIGEARQISVSKTSGNLFSSLGVAPAAGRLYAERDATPGSENIVILSHTLARDLFGDAQGAVGRSIALDGLATRIIGVMPLSFRTIETEPDAWMPLVIDPKSWQYRGGVAQIIARLKPGVTPDLARAELAALLPEWRRAVGHPLEFGADIAVVRLHDALVGDIRPTLLIVLGAAGFILLIAGANIANLLLVRALGRSREIAIRAALGAERLQLVRQLLIESALLSAIGGALGIAVGTIALRGLVSLLPPDTPRLSEISLHGAALLVAVSLSLVAGLLGGIAPAFMASRVGGSTLLRGEVTATTGAGARTLRSALVIAEIAVALVLTVGAGLMLQTMWHLANVELGFDAGGVLTFRVQPSASSYPTGAQGREYYRALFQRLAAVPGVERVGAIHHLPLSGYAWGQEIEIAGRPLAPGATPPRVDWRIATPGYFAAMGIPIMSGRTFGESDAVGSPPVVMINDAMARRFFGTAGAAVGQRLRSVRNPKAGWSTVVGVVGNVRHAGVQLEPALELYNTLGQFWMPAMSITVRSTSNPLALAPAVRAAVGSVDRNVAVADMTTLEAVVSRNVARPRVIMALLVGFAVVGVALGVVGIYGVLAHAVAQRTREFGVRAALGAAQGDLIRLVLWDGGRQAAAGLAVGTAAAFLLTPLMETMLFGVEANDPTTVASLSLFLGLVALAAAYVPARRVAALNPVAALRSE